MALPATEPIGSAPATAGHGGLGEEAAADGFDC